jgi:copper chaperone
MEKTILDISGMTCSGCAQSVTRVLSGLNGVEKVAVSLDRANAEITFDPKVVNLDDFRFVVRAAGFDPK